MGLFGPRRPVSEDEWEWQLSSFKWMIEEFGGIEENPDNVLILPTPEFFPKTSTDPNRKAQDIFDRVKQLSGMSDWPTKLESGEKSRDLTLGNGQEIKHERHAPAGDYQLKQDDDGNYFALIRYNPSHVDDPTKLIATFAHELSHYLMNTAKTAPPGGWDIHELTTDLCSIYLGFGIFLAMSAWNFQGHSDGWQYERQGYLNERMLITGIAIWETLAGRDPLKAVPYLKPHLAKDLKMAVRYIEKRNLSDEVMAMDLGLRQPESKNVADA